MSSEAQHELAAKMRALASGTFGPAKRNNYYGLGFRVLGLGFPKNLGSLQTKGVAGGREVM